MPLNQSQRDEIEKSISHFFYGLATEPRGFTQEITAISQAINASLPKVNEQKETEEKHQGGENPFAELSKVISAIESLLKGLENRNNQSIITVNEVIEYIIFFAICRIQYHLEHPSDSDDFNIRTWLQAHGAAESDLSDAWQLQDLLTKTHANQTLADRGWNTATTFLQLARRNNTLFKTHKPNVDYGSYNFNWDLPELHGRMYSAVIKENWIETKDSQGKPLPPIPSIDLHIASPITQQKKIVYHFKPYPATRPLTNAELNTIETQLNSQVFETAEDKVKARQAAIGRIEDAQALAIEERIKADACIRAEKEAIKLIVSHLESLDKMTSHSPAQLRNDSDDEFYFSDHEHHPLAASNNVSPAPNPIVTHSAIQADLEQFINGLDDEAVEFDVGAPPPSPQPVSAEAGGEVKRATEVVIGIPSLLRAPAHYRFRSPPPIVAPEFKLSSAPVARQPGHNATIELSYQHRNIDSPFALHASVDDDHPRAPTPPRLPSPQTPDIEQGLPDRFEEDVDQILREMEGLIGELNVHPDPHIETPPSVSATTQNPFVVVPTLPTAPTLSFLRSSPNLPRVNNYFVSPTLTALNQAAAVSQPQGINDFPVLPPLPALSRALTLGEQPPVSQPLVASQPLFVFQPLTVSQPINAHSLLPRPPRSNRSRVSPIRIAHIATANEPSNALPPALFPRARPRRLAARHTSLHFLAAPPAPKPSVTFKEDGINTNTPGLILATYSYYYDEIIAERISLAGLQTFSATETNNLKSFAVMSFLKSGLMEKNVALTLKPGIKKLLEAHHYFNYFQLHPEALAAFMDITLGKANFLILPYVTNLLEREKITPNDALAFTTDEETIIKHGVYGEYFYRVPAAIASIKGIVSTECEMLLNLTISGLIDKNLLTIDGARALMKRLLSFQRDVLLDETCRELFLKGKLITVDNLTPEQATHLRDKKICALIDQDILSVETGMNLNANDKAAYSQPITHTLLLAKKITPAEVHRFSPHLATLMRTEPYATELGKNPEFLLLFMTWTDDDLNHLLAPSILALFQKNLLNLEQLRDRSPDFFEMLKNDKISALLLAGKMTVAQALSLTSRTWTEIVYNNSVNDLLQANTEHNKQLTAIPLKIWGWQLRHRLIAIYQQVPEVHNNLIDTTDAINAEINIIANAEQIQQTTLQQHVIGLFLTFLRDEINNDLRNIPADRIPPVYTHLLHDINQTLTNPQPQWLTTLAQAADHAKAGLLNMHRFQPTLVSVNNRPVLHQNFLTQPTKITPAGVRHFCEHLLKITQLDATPQPSARLSHRHRE
jgi:hypothetical protein